MRLQNFIAVTRGPLPAIGIPKPALAAPAMVHLRSSLRSPARRALRRPLPACPRQSRVGPCCPSQNVQHGAVAPRRWRQMQYSTEASPPRRAEEKPFYVTTPIFYVNAAPHLGHMYSMVLADAFKRWHSLRGQPSLLLTGVDEHGIKVQTSAEVQAISTHQLCDLNAAQFQELAHHAGIDYNSFMRTTDPTHKEAVLAFWTRLRKAGYIGERDHEGWYATTDEAFYPDSAIERTVDLASGYAYFVSIETGSVVERYKEKNYHFKLTAFKDRLLAWYRENPDWIKPRARMNEVVAWVENSLTDLSISRSANRLSWGISVPEDPSQVIYVWVDALINYLTYSGFPDWQRRPGQNPQHESPEQAPSAPNELQPVKIAPGCWPADLHVIGKDIVRFHCVYWPALLMALDLPLPRQVLSHAHWTMNRIKMSKSLGNIVNPRFVMERYGADALRLFLLAEGGIDSDTDYDNRGLMDRWNATFADGLGNTTMRLTRPIHIWDMRQIVTSAVENGTAARMREYMKGPKRVIGTVGFNPSRIDDPLDYDTPGKMYSAVSSQVVGLREPAETADRSWKGKQLELLDMIAGELARQMEAELSPAMALRTLHETTRTVNAMLTTARPWETLKWTGKTWSEKDTLRARDVLLLAAEGMRIVGILMQPFVPISAARMLDELGVRPDRRGFEWARVLVDFDYGRRMQDGVVRRNGPLFPKLYD